MKTLKGRIWTFGDNIDTDAIIPARYLNTSDPASLAAHCMEDADPDFMKKMRPGDILVAGDNFGCGSSREHAPIAIKAAGIACVVAKSFARIFYRNAFNMGLLLLELGDDIARIKDGDELEIDVAAGTIANLTSGETIGFNPVPKFMMDMLSGGGLVEYVKRKVAQ